MFNGKALRAKAQAHLDGRPALIPLGETNILPSLAGLRLQAAHHRFAQSLLIVFHLSDPIKFRMSAYLLLLLQTGRSASGQPRP
jgi:hypothetical protein